MASKAVAIRSILPQDEPLHISRDQMTLLMMESYKKAGNAAEEMVCLREVAKMNGLYEKQPGVQVNVLNIEQHVKKLETLSDEELLRMAGHQQNLFQPQTASDLSTEHTVDAVFSEVADEVESED